MKYMESHSLPLVISSGKSSTSYRKILFTIAGNILWAVNATGKHQTTLHIIIRISTAAFFIPFMPAPRIKNVSTTNAITATAKKPVLDAVNNI